ncbi:MAG: hypothetical protein A2V92_01220 [Candidatus Muproteobacteria bacterium RBG_16_65_31]|uniref:Uncharacterized protein n=1 Tax=Candidatus Muproteobacteria bacterium RBG_16_65_31 TaxID=1817759 RepID=A0A1F6TG21_9PROT|nr:MAG: hypothetical protein A2V92_01220 [Candidatus Muproteobacteria bacterium RBG_16_65_31]
MSDARFYSMRRLLPYQGTIQLVEAPGFRAMSTDGVTWQVQIMNRGARYSTYGVWRPDGGGNLIDTERTGAFIEVLRRLPPLPFPLADKLELWLLDAAEQSPLALLTSTLDRGSPPRVSDTTWRPALAGDKSFFAPSIESASKNRDPRAAPTHCEILSRLVHTAAGPHARAQWFRRDESGAGLGLEGCRLEDALVGRELGAESFPELLLRAEWRLRVDAALVRDYHDWHAAALLTHDNLTRATRDRLERAACRQAEKLYHLRLLLPEVVNPDLVKVALVEAVIRRSASPAPA